MRKTSIFDPEVPVDAPEDGYALKPSGALQVDHTTTRRLSGYALAAHKLEDEHSVLCGIRGIRYPLQAMLRTYNYGNVRAAMSEQLAAEVLTEHKPFIDLEREEGYTHRVDDPEPEVHSKPKPAGIDWRTNIYDV